MARDLTAFELAKVGDSYVGIQGKDKVIQIRSEKSVARLHAGHLACDLLRPVRSLKTVEVKFGGGNLSADCPQSAASGVVAYLAS
jgi:hypothetical protein